LAQSLGALIQRRGGPPLEQLPGSCGEPLSEITVQYPVIVCPDTDTPGFYHAEIENHPSTVGPAPARFQLEVDYAYTGKHRIMEEYFIIDVFRLSQLESFLESLQRKANETRLLLGN
jgi:hypothetical protein